MKRRAKKLHYGARPIKRETPVAGIVSAVLIVVGAWAVSWWAVPLAAFIASAVWRGRATLARQVTWGAVTAWVIILLVDSLHGRTWALARAAGGAVFLPWGLLFPVTLLFAAGLAWSTATLVQGVVGLIAARRRTA